MGCRLRHIDEAVAICELKRYVADADLASDTPYTPDCDASTGRHVAILGAGPAGLSAAYYLRQFGHDVTIHHPGATLGGRLRDGEDLPAEVLDAEIAMILKLGVNVRSGWCSEGPQE